MLVELILADAAVMGLLGGIIGFGIASGLYPAWRLPPLPKRRPSKHSEVASASLPMIPPTLF